MHAHNGYVRVFEGDIHACFDEISHTALLGRVRGRIKDKRVVALVRAFLKAGVLAEGGFVRDTPAGTPQGGILSPLLANIALSVLDEHFDAKWDAQGSTASARWWNRKKGGASYRLVRYADLCRARHKSAYAEARIMPTRMSDALVSGVSDLLMSA